MEPTIKLEHTDARGEIYSISLPDNRELMLIHSKTGAFRGGHSHSCDEIVVMLSGSMRYHRTNQDYPLSSPQLMWQGGISHNRANQDHMGEFLEDSWLIEYKFAEKGSWTQTDFEPMRERVRASI